MQLSKQPNLTRQIMIAMLLGSLFGIAINWLPTIPLVETYITEGVLDVGGKIFITVLKMLVVPIVFVSLVCGACSLDDSRHFGRLAIKTIVLYIITTAVAITIALFFADLFAVGKGNPLPLPATATFDPANIPSLKDTLLNIFPSNPIAALAAGNMLQIIVFALALGIAITWSGNAGKRIIVFFRDMDIVIMNLMHLVMRIAPYGVFCLIAHMFAQLGVGLIAKLAGYFSAVFFVLMVQLLVTYSLLLFATTGLSPIIFLRKMFPAMIFAFSTSSSNASIPVVLNTVETKLGVKERIAAFVIPLGATINMDGTAIMQGVATVFIANTYGIDLTFAAYLKVILVATLASIGTAGVPSVGLITLTMVLLQVGLPIEGIALIIGVDRLLDMTRTAVNVSGDSVVSVVVGKSEKAVDEEIYHR